VANLKLRKILVLSLLSCYAGLLFYFSQNGRPGPWHDQCVNDWNHQKWQDLTSLSENLISIGKADPEVLYVGSLAAGQVGRSEEQQKLAALLLRQRFLNPPMEMEISRLIQPDTALENVRLFRSRVTLGIVTLLMISNFIAYKSRFPSIWQMILPAIGGVLLFV
jgi:hypothetical protein